MPLYDTHDFAHHITNLTIQHETMEYIHHQTNIDCTIIDWYALSNISLEYEHIADILLCYDILQDID